MAKMTEAEIQQKLAEGWWWGGGVKNTSPGILYFGSKNLDGVVTAVDPNFDPDQEEADFNQDGEKATG